MLAGRFLTSAVLHMYLYFRRTTLEQLESWEPTFSERIEAAVKNNDQIEYSFGVSERVNALVKKWA